MQLIAGRVGQEYNQRKSRKGAFWEGRYFASAICTDHHLFQCLVYIDLNMVRAGVVSHPAQWKVSGYNEIQSPAVRYRIIDREALVELGEFTDYEDFRKQHREWVKSKLNDDQIGREPHWTEAIAVGPENYIANMKSRLSTKVYYRSVTQATENTFVIRDGEDLGFQFQNENARFKRCFKD
jgi:hypothetical protein